MNPAACRRPSMPPTWAASAASCGRTCASTRSAAIAALEGFRRLSSPQHGARPQLNCAVARRLCQQVLTPCFHDLKPCLTAPASVHGSAACAQQRYALSCTWTFCIEMTEVLSIPTTGHIYQLGPESRSRASQHLDTRVPPGSRRQGCSAGPRHQAGGTRSCMARGAGSCPVRSWPRSCQAFSSCRSKIDCTLHTAAGPVNTGIAAARAMR